MYRPINRHNHSERKPSCYSRFIFFIGTALSAGLLLCAAILLHIAPRSVNTYTHLHYINMGKCCIESALAAMVSALFAAAVGDYLLKHPGR